MEKTNDKLLELKARLELIRYYVTISPGQYEYFTKYFLARDFAKCIGAKVKFLD